jgi:prepilin-type N-terminal cleavage/methylation domain-containing protein
MKKHGFTLVELLTVLAVISMLLALFAPAAGMVRRIAREAKQKAQLGTMAVGLQAFRNDYGDYPPSDSWSWIWDPASRRLEVDRKDYSGAQKLVEALMGWDLTGFHPESEWRADGTNASPYTKGMRVFRPGTFRFYDPASTFDIEKRKGVYVDMGVENVVRLGPLFDPIRPGELALDRYAFCDTFGWKKVQVGNGTIKAGSPVLYYRADTSSRTLDGASIDNRIYDVRDNIDIIAAKNVAEGKPADFALGEPTGATFYPYITDPRVSRPWPYRPDSYLLVTAGHDGVYGTADDICNFGL